MAVSDFRVADLRSEIQKKIEERNVIENKLKEEAREPGLDSFSTILCKACHLFTVWLYYL